MYEYKIRLEMKYDFVNRLHNRLLITKTADSNKINFSFRMLYTLCLKKVYPFYFCDYYVKC